MTAAENENESFYDDPFKMIRNNFDFAYVCEFLHKFSSAFFNGSDDPLPTTPFMEHLLLYQDDSAKINQFYMKILKPLPGWRLISQDNWLESLAKEYRKRELELDISSPTTASTILTIPLLQRLEMLRNLCDFHLEQPDHFWELLRVNDGESEWRLEPIGRDSDNRRYWLFSDARFYREIEGINYSIKSGKLDKKDKKRASSRTSNKSTEKDEPIPWDFENESNWELVCLTRADYDEFLETFAKTNNKPVDKSFVKFIREEIIPEIEPVLNYQLSQHKKYFRPQPSERISLLPRKRSSRLLEKEIEDEKRRLADQEAEKERQAMRRALLAERSSLIPSSSEIEKDLAAEREMRAEARRMKREKELQIKAIEEAFYSSYDQKPEADSEEEEGEDGEDNNIDIDINNHDIDIVNEEIIPKSPIKVVLKLSKPQETKISQPDFTDENVIEKNEKAIDDENLEITDSSELITKTDDTNDLTVNEEHHEPNLNEQSNTESVSSDKVESDTNQIVEEEKKKIFEKNYLDLLSDAIEEY